MICSFCQTEMTKFDEDGQWVYYKCPNCSRILWKEKEKKDADVN